jgi:hypothetical protein
MMPHRTPAPRRCGRQLKGKTIATNGPATEPDTFRACIFSIHIGPGSGYSRSKA